MTKNSGSFQAGPVHRRGKGGRPNPLDDPEFCKKVAEMFAAGCNRKEMGEVFDRTPETITAWRRDPRVKSYALKLIEDRVLQITRKVDGVIASRLEKANEMTVAELIAIRKEFLGGALRMQTEQIDDATVGEAAEWVDRNPDLAAQLAHMFEDGTVPGVSSIDKG